MSNATTIAKPEEVLDVAAIRKDFPIYRTPVYEDKPLVFLDNAATSHKPDVVIEAITRFYSEQNANVHRALHLLAERATNAFEGARTKLAAFINAPDERNVIFTRGSTEGINMVMKGWGRKHVGPGDSVIVTEVEHHSNFVPWQTLAKETGATFAMVPMHDGLLDLDELDRLLQNNPKIVAVNMVSNALGIENAYEEIIQRAHAAGALVMLDAAQAAPHIPIDVQALDCDFIAFSGHKMCGPTGVGIFWARAELQDDMDPWLYGGEMISTVTFEETTWNVPPHKFEAGTPNIAGCIGLGAAVDYLTGVGMDKIHQHVGNLSEYLAARLAEVPNTTIFAKAGKRAAAVSFQVEGIPPHDMATLLDEQGIAIRAGQLCAQPAMDHYGVSGMARASLYFYNHAEDIDRLIDGIHVARKIFGYGR